MAEQELVKKIEMRDTGSLKFYGGNAKRHPEEQVEKIKDSIRRFGFLVPVGINSESVIIFGHGRVMAARECGLEQVPVVVIDHLSEEEERAFRIADNKLAESDWNYEILAEEFRFLQNADFDCALTGFEEGEISAFLQCDDFSSMVDTGGDEGDGGDEDEEGVRGSEPVDSGISLVFVMEPEERDMVVGYLGGIRDKRGLNTISQALVEIARERHIDG